MNRILPDREYWVPGWRGLAAYGLVVLAVVSILYWKVMPYPHVHDDWKVLAYADNHTVLEAFTEFFPTQGRTFFRPFSMMYHVLLYRVFGDNAHGFRMLALLILAADAMLAALVLNALMRNTRAAALAGICFAGAATLWVDPLMWEVGINELGGVFFAMLSLWLFSRRRYSGAALAYLCALCFKEMGALLPAVMLVVWFVDLAEGGHREKARTFLRAFWPYLLIIPVYAFAKMGNRNIFALPDRDVYAARIDVLQILAHILWYVHWLVEDLFPPLIHCPWWNKAFGWLSAHLRVGILALGAVAGCMFGITYVAGRRGGKTRRFLLGRYAILGAWFILLLLPTALIVRHQYRYYVLYAAIPFFFLLFWMIQGVVALAWRQAARPLVVPLVFLLLKLALGTQFFSGLDSHGMHGVRIDGDGNAFGKAITTRTVKRALLDMYPDLPENSNLVFMGIHVPAFTASGPRFWYGDNTLSSYDSDSLHIRDGRLLLQIGIQDAYAELDLQKTYFFRRKGESIEDYTDVMRAIVRRSGEAGTGE